ncbi:hypothetical protein PML89_09725 (plasmid) [Vagococcus lutrae]|uniref:hypothetical protein n=1 Tax=Vagococcus lutrae TaxID=81947 RepID=UPI00232D00D2|nr:hypothetical protein [Vagococcus lutrae]WCG06107.1 hypothetical protein PML89_09725 [Vagococcus lutrae]
MTENKDNKDIAESYALGLALIAVAVTIFLIPDEYKFLWSNTFSMICLMLASVGFAFSIQKTMANAKDTWDNLGTSLIIFYVVYGIILLLLKFNLLNPYSTSLLLFISLFAFFGFFKGITNLIIYLFKNFKNNKTNFFEILLKLIPIFLPVISLILQVLKII